MSRMLPNTQQDSFKEGHTSIDLRSNGTLTEKSELILGELDEEPLSGIAEDEA